MKIGTLVSASGDFDVDCHGMLVQGADDDGAWWGTRNAWVVLGDPIDGDPDVPPSDPHMFEVYGPSYEGTHFQAFVLASSEEVARMHLTCFFVGSFDVVDAGPMRRCPRREWRRGRQLRAGDVWHVTDSDLDELG